MFVRRQVAAVAATLVWSVAACTDADDEPGPPASPEPSARPTPAASSSEAFASPSATTTQPVGGPEDAPAPVEPETELLAWQPLPGPPELTALTNGEWTLTVRRNGTGYQLDGPSSGSGKSVSAGQRHRITDAFLDERWAVVVFSDTRETQQARAEVTELSTGEGFSIDASSDEPTTVGGTWALGDSTVAHATTPESGDYCLATVDLASRRSARGWCAKPGNGFNQARLSDQGVTILTFDAGSPSCRTVAVVKGDAIEPLLGVPECKGWEGVLTENGAVWSVIPKERRIEAARIFARVGEDYFDLGPGLTGSLRPCGEAVYFVRDPQLDGERARLMRWDGATLAVVYESPAGRVFIEPPRCGGKTITVSAFAESGNEQVWAGVEPSS